MTEDIEYTISLTKSRTHQIIWIDFDYFDFNNEPDLIVYDPINNIKFQKINNDYVSTSAVYNKSLVDYLVNNQIVSIVLISSKRYKKYVLKLTTKALLTVL
jgi:hypothetical protein